MIEKEFLKNITLLYVEDDPLIRESMQGVFQKLFKDVLIASDGEEGFRFYEEAEDHNSKIDIIISDINMPKMNGIELIQKIRIVDPDIPVIFTTAYSDVSFLLEAIELNIVHYAVKPVNLNKLIVAVQDATKKHYDSKIIKTQKEQNDRYINVINQVALVSKTDLHGTITYVNDIFCEVSGYTKRELIGQNQRIVRHEDMTTSYFDTLWNNLRDGKIWKGKIKNKSKIGEEYIVNLTVIPLFSILGDEIVEYMSVGYVVTKEEQEKREFQRKVIQKLKDQKNHQTSLEDKIKSLEQNLETPTTSELISFKLTQEKEKNEKLNKQLLYYESQIDQHNHEALELKKKVSLLEHDSFEYKKLLTLKLQEAKEEIIKDKKIIEAQLIEAQNLNTYLQESNKKIKELQDVILHQEGQLKAQFLKNEKK